MVDSLFIYTNIYIHLNYQNNSHKRGKMNKNTGTVAGPFSREPITNLLFLYVSAVYFSFRGLFNSPYSLFF